MLCISVNVTVRVALPDTSWSVKQVNIRDGLDDYDEDFSLAKLVGNIISEGASKSGKAGAGDETAKAAAPENGVDADNDDVGDGEDDMLEEGEEEVAEVNESKAGNVEEVEADGDDKKRKEPRPDNVRPPDNAVK